MARTTQEIFNQIVAEKNNQPSLNALNSPSQVAIWRLWAWIVAFMIQLHEQLFDLFVLEVRQIASNAITGTLPWYQQIALGFQYNISTVYLLGFDVSGKAGYQILNTADQIIEYASVNESSGGQLIVKVAKDMLGVPTPLNAAELTSFSDYMQFMKFAGTRLQCISLAADKLKISATVYYDPIAPLAIVKSLVEDAITRYVSSLNFNGLIYTEQIQDAVQGVSPVISVAMGQCEANIGSGFVVFNRYYQTHAGYAIIDPTNALSATITYIASNV